MRSSPPTLIERGMDVRSNHPLSAQPGIRGSIPPRKAWVASSSAPSNRELEARRKLKIPPTSGTVDEPTTEEAAGLGGYTRGCASAPPRILGTHEDMKATKASTNTNLRKIKPHPCEGSGATVGHLQKGYPNLGPKLLGIKIHDDINLAPRPSKGPPSQRGNDHPRAGGFRLVRGSAASRATPTLERVVSLELAIQARAGLAGNNAQRTATHRSRHDAVKKQGSLLHAITYSPEKTSATSKETMERRAQDTTLDAVNCHEKKDDTSAPAMSSAGVGRRDSRSHMHSATNTCTSTPLPLVYKRGREAHAKSKTRRDHKRAHRILGLRSSSLSPNLLVNPYYEQHAIRCIAPLLDVRPSGRNQDKTLSLTLAIRETSDSSSPVSRGHLEPAMEKPSPPLLETPPLALSQPGVAGGSMSPGWIQITIRSLDLTETVDIWQTNMACVEKLKHLPPPPVGSAPRSHHLYVGHGLVTAPARSRIASCIPRSFFLGSVERIEELEDGLFANNNMSRFQRALAAAGLAGDFLSPPHSARAQTPPPCGRGIAGALRKRRLRRRGIYSNHNNSICVPSDQRRRRILTDFGGLVRSPNWRRIERFFEAASISRSYHIIHIRKQDADPATLPERWKSSTVCAFHSVSAALLCLSI
nr:unnamed protein product [Digitaria exilis]